MTRQIAFLRAVNLGRRTVAMPRLVAACEELGYRDVWTYANSGNVAFTTTGSRERIETTMEKALDATFGFEVTTFVRTAAELRTALAEAPFTLEKGDTYFITFMKKPLPAATRAALEAASNDFDTLLVRGRDVHWCMRGRSTATTLTAKTWRLAGKHSTSRNVNMLSKLAAKLDS